MQVHWGTAQYQNVLLDMQQPVSCMYTTKQDHKSNNKHKDTAHYYSCLAVNVTALYRHAMLGP